MKAQWPAPEGSVAANGDPVALMSSLARSHPGLHVLALGPLTTVAAALRDADVRASRPRIVVSGGAVSVPGNMAASGNGRPVAEWNIGIDPTAAAEVLGSGVATSWVPLDASNQVPIDIWFARALAAEKVSRSGAVAQAFLKTNASLAAGGSYFWDPLAAVALTDRTALSWRRMNLTIGPTGSQTGRTISGPRGTGADVAVAASQVVVGSTLLRGFADPSTSASAEPYARGVASVRVTMAQGAFAWTAPPTLPAGQTTFGFDPGSGPGFSVVVARLASHHSYEEVQQLISRGLTTSVPAWVIVEAQVDVPAGAQPTWLIDLPAGNHVVVAADPDGTGVTSLGQIRTG
jgi:hypothetical protein